MDGRKRFGAGLACTGLVVAAAATLTPSADAAIIVYTAELKELNDSGARGRAVLVHDTTANTLDVTIDMVMVEAMHVHPQHIHGRFDGDLPIDSVVPPFPEADDDGDGWIEVGEGAEFYGPVILPLNSPPGSGAAGFPEPDLPVYHFEQLYDLSDSSIFAGSFTADDLFPLNFREIVIHGRTVATGYGAGTTGEVDGTGGYKAALPIAAGEIVLIPEPASIALFAAGVAMIVRRRRSA